MRRRGPRALFAVLALTIAAVASLTALTSSGAAATGPTNTAPPTIAGTAGRRTDADRRSWQVDRDGSDHLRLCLAALLCDGRELRADPWCDR